MIQVDRVIFMMNCFQTYFYFVYYSICGHNSWKVSLEPAAIAEKDRPKGEDVKLNVTIFSITLTMTFNSSIHTLTL